MNARNDRPDVPEAIHAPAHAAQLVETELQNLLQPVSPSEQTPRPTREQQIRAGAIVMVHQYGTLGALLDNKDGIAERLDLKHGVYHTGPYAEHSRTNQVKLRQLRRRYGSIALGRPYDPVSGKMVDTPGTLSVYVQKEAYVKRHGEKAYYRLLDAQRIKSPKPTKKSQKPGTLKIVR